MLVFIIIIYYYYYFFYLFIFEFGEIFFAAFVIIIPNVPSLYGFELNLNSVSS